jgi:hypothetical protein
MRTLLTGMCCAAVVVACSSYPPTTELIWVEAPVDGGLRVAFDHPCPEGGAVHIQVEETESSVIVTGYVTGGMVIDCVGDWTAVGLANPLAGRQVIDGSTGRPVEVQRP